MSSRTYSIRQIDRSFTDLQNFLKDEVASKKAELAVQKSSGALDMQNKNLFTRVVMSSLQEGSKGLNDDDIIGNLFTYLFAGVSLVIVLLRTAQD